MDLFLHFIFHPSDKDHLRSHSQQADCFPNSHRPGLLRLHPLPICFWPSFCDCPLLDFNVGIDRFGLFAFADILHVNLLCSLQQFVVVDHHWHSPIHISNQKLWKRWNSKLGSGRYCYLEDKVTSHNKGFFQRLLLILLFSYQCVKTKL